MKRVLSTLLLLCCFLRLATAGEIRVQPTNWWAGMHNPSLQLLLYGSHIGKSDVSLSAPDVRLERVVRPSNDNYLLLYLDTQGAAAQTFDIVLRQGRNTQRIPYRLLARSSEPRGTWDASDVVYLLMPDRFVNGDRRNDHVAGLREPDVDLRNTDARHGGDIAGMTAQLDYLADLGITALWHTPTQVNDMPPFSYHGYAITDYYETDPRLGTNDDYRHFVAEAHKRGIKVIMDLVFNHCGTENFLYKDVPDSTWFNHGSRYVQTNYKISAVGDPHAVETDRRSAQDGWFVSAMPDWNQRNADVLTYLIQSSIWWIEYARIDGIRQDTYPYCDAEAMAQWCRAVEREYPGFNIVGETWLNHNVGVARWQKGNRLTAPRDPELPTVMDFPLMNLLNSALDEETNDWDKGLARLYEYLSQDAIYADPMHLLTFLDNHDTPRFARNAEQAADTARYQQALTLLLTLRGIPQLYYGNELAMYADRGRGDGAMRELLPVAALRPEGRTALQRQTFDFTRRLLRWRRGNAALAKGTMQHYAVRNGVYVYARRTEGRTVTVLMNGTSEPRTVATATYADLLPDRTAHDVVGDRRLTLGDSLTLAPRGLLILDFTKD